ncbi:MAG: hypothetical protein FJX29_14655, partial [Alphaproteobacteria bacterium]|nr:hypothetical protein [Alphaproteobacteria bacterium]
MLSERKITHDAPPLVLERAIQRRRLRPLARRNTAAIRAFFGALAALCDLAAIIASALAAGWLYHFLAYDQSIPAEYLFRQGYVIAVLFVVPNLALSEYVIAHYLSFETHAGRVFVVWNIAFVAALLLAFITKTSADVSRGAALMFYAAGLGALLFIRLTLVRIVRDRTREGGVAAQRIFLVGFEADVRAFQARYDTAGLGLDVVCASILRGP